MRSDTITLLFSTLTCLLCSTSAQVDLDECATGTHNCEQICCNTISNWTCDCNPGYSLHSDGRTCEDINECLTSNGGCHHTCTNSIGSYTCSCGLGFALAADNRGCINMNECLDPLIHGCQQTCVDIVGSHYCVCNPGYTLDTNGRNCTADPCAYQLVAPQDGRIYCTGTSTDDNCTFDCNPGFSLSGEYLAMCLPNHQWSAPQPLCTRLTCGGDPEPPDFGYVVQPCSDAFGQTCHIACNTGYQLVIGNTNRSCTANPLNPTELLWTTDVTTFCGDVDECQTNNGGCSCAESIPRESGCFSQCNNTVGSFFCTCTAGFILGSDYLTCHHPSDVCGLTNHGCEHQCINTNGTYKCLCNSGYRLNSDMRGCSDIDECSDGISGCNQTCTNTIGSYTCSCQSRFYTLNADGYTCDDVDECLINNGSCNYLICQNYYGGHRCVCRQVASSIINTTSIISNPDNVMDTYSVVVTCEINPTSTAEYCEVIARNDDAGKPARSNSATIINDMATVTVNGLMCGEMYTILAGGTNSIGNLVGPQFHKDTVTAGVCPTMITSISSESDDCDDITGAIIGALIGGIVGIIFTTLLFLTILWWHYKMQKKKSGSSTAVSNIPFCDVQGSGDADYYEDIVNDHAVAMTGNPSYAVS